MCIIGAGIHKFGRFSESLEDIGREAAIMALKSAGVEWKQMDAAFVSNARNSVAIGHITLTPLGRTGISILDMRAACASGVAAMQQGHLAIASGMYDMVLVLGMEKQPRGFLNPVGTYASWLIDQGLSQNPMYWALRARRHMYEYGTTKEQLGMISMKNHKHGALNPYAMYQKVMTLDEIMNSPMINDPLTLFMVCAPNDGAAAVVLCSKEIASKYSIKPVTLSASVHKISLYPIVISPTYRYTTKVNPTPVTKMAADEAYKRSGIGPEDLNVVECQDTDAFSEIEAYEDLGLCKLGEGGKMIENGETELDGHVAVNPSGGLISKGEPLGASHVAQVVELYWQLMGESGPRQVKNAKVALAHVKGAGGNTGVSILKV
ncbi:thiolase family protein [Chloroflexota bacterium]